MKSAHMSYWVILSPGNIWPNMNGGETLIKSVTRKGRFTPHYSLSKESTMVAPIEAGMVMMINLLTAMTGSDTMGNLSRAINTKATTNPATV